LYLVATGTLPRASDLGVRNLNAIAAALKGALTPQSFGAVVTNPPFVKLDHLKPEEREIYRRYLGGIGGGRLDAYIPFVHLCLNLAEPGGFICLVLPQVFLTASNAAALRRSVSEEFDVRCLVDLSAIPVFEGTGSYTILLIAQRRRSTDTEQGLPAMVAQVTEGIGIALQACLDGRTVRSPYYSVFPVGQRFFHSKNWVLVSPEQAQIDDRLRELPRLSNFMTVRQGYVSGADDVFIVMKSDVPEGEERIYVDLLPDRQIARYRLPAATSQMVFFPYDGNQPLTETILSQRFPGTWAYLLLNKNKLTERKSVISGTVPWWRPERPREPSTLLRPKVVCPHLMLTPRFAVDTTGKFAVSHAPFIIANDEGEEQTLLRVFCAVLNSSVCNWHLRTYAPKYGGGYNRLEVTLLKGVPVPDFSRTTAGAIAEIVRTVDRLARHTTASLDSELDDLIASLYGFTPGERRNLFKIVERGERSPA
jgi:hypothetical protein